MVEEMGPGWEKKCVRRDSNVSRDIFKFSRGEGAGVEEVVRCLAMGESVGIVGMVEKVATSSAMEAVRGAGALLLHNGELGCSRPKRIT